MTASRKKHDTTASGHQSSWRPITGYEGAYEVSSEGRVRSVTRIGASTVKVRLITDPI